MHLWWLRVYLDKLDEDIKKTTKASFTMSLKAIQTLQNNKEIIKEQVEVMENKNILYKLRIKELEAINQSIRLKLAHEEKIPLAMAP